MKEPASARSAAAARPAPRRDPRRRPRLAPVEGVPEENFSGELVLYDLAGIAVDDRVAARAILVRFLVVQYFTNWLRGDWPSQLLRQQRSAALNALGGGLPLDPEQRTLRSAVERGAGAWSRPVVRLLLRSAVAAKSRAQPAGALALCRVAYEAAVAGAWWEEGAVAAFEIEGLGSLLGSARNGARWRRRGVALARAARRATEAEA